MLTRFVGLCFFLFLLSTQTLRAQNESLPALGPAPDFQLTDQNGNSFSSHTLKGHVWIADFIFTRCLGVCPIMSAQMARLQRHLESEPVKLVSFSVDPDHDTPAILQDYAAKYEAGDHWVFLTGERQTIWEIASSNFHLGVGQATPEEMKQGAQPVLHSNRFVLVDQTGQIRGYFEGTNPDTIDHLAKLAKQLDAASS
ncbi:MAG: hypothetical protein COV74_02495 [Candidatus Omnitrophica bacterium CG11_big_fil_rev_8_21_14_0_20_45_26]|uniref:Thioredoxin domain-containing protein n=1 Tax=Candidatus Abzuiibacterium crystallinum TaxID=1974748 RepID=A0A2H0LRI9_9BACT|nr:MAG: hypothetical protein COV74_02495 [Candidatus Omnitrophica bacterium CG11_big_fil_rev_8_21_14_0_20_45_26]PIW65705.1 MAG: hypothetical protein COW12_00340 [Candidatus Omnitrophica bacterium CG12_big_fil_rev_8_21_14_0_65_45_16]